MKHTLFATLTINLGLASLLQADPATQNPAPAAAPTPAPSATEATAGAAAAPTGDSVPLFDGKSLTGWTDRNGKTLEANEGWKILPDGVLHKAGKGGDIFTAREYANFELTWEWKISQAGNGGIKYRVTAYGRELLGPEYQMLDDAKHADGKLATHRTGCIYDLFPAPEAAPKAPGEWNQSKLVVQGSKFEHWLNGKMVASCDTTSETWKEAFGKSKFKRHENWAQNPAGRIMIQDHGDPIWIRGLNIKELK